MSDQDGVADGGGSSASEEPADDVVSEVDRNESTTIEVRTAFLFFKEIPSDFRLKQPDSDIYTKIGPGDREAIVEQMNAFLTKVWTAEELFPDTSSDFVLTVPRRYTTIRSQDINAMFPHADVNMRRLLDRYVEVFTHNFRTRMEFRRAAQIIGSFVIFFTGWWLVDMGHMDERVGELSSHLPASLESSVKEWIWPIAAYIAAYFAGYFVFRSLIWLMAYVAQLAREHSAQAVSQNLLERLQFIRNCINEINISERDLYDREEEIWVSESNYYMALLVWLSMRVYHLENYFQIKMARIRTAMWFMQWAGVGLAVMIALLAYVTVQFLPEDWFVGGSHGKSVYVIAVFVMAFHTSLFGATRLDAIRKLITIDQWQTFGRIKVHEQIASVVAFLIRKFIMIRDTGRDRTVR